MTYKIALVGEAYGVDEERVKKPFVGASGRLLNHVLETAGLRRQDCYATNVFNLRPPHNDVNYLCKGKMSMPKDYSWPALKQGSYVLPEFLPEVDRLRSELETLRPNLIVALGNTACWALTRRTGIKALRGAVTPCTLVPGLKVLPTWHPAATMRDYSLRPTLILDLIKARVESDYPEIRRPSRTLLLEPTIADLWAFWHSDLREAKYISVDIENPRETISCIGFAPSPHRCLVVPFEDPTKPDWSYWATPKEEKEAWLWVRMVLRSDVPKIGQNFGSYDILHLWKSYGLRVNNFADDTMLLHHSLMPEEKKDLGFLGSLYVNDSAWKRLNDKREKSIKRDQ